MIAVIRLVLIGLLGLLSLLTVCKAPTYRLWMAAVAVDELPWVFVIFIVILLVSGIWVTKYQWQGAITGLAALVLFLTPVIRAYAAGSALEEGLRSAFGGVRAGKPGQGQVTGIGPRPSLRMDPAPFRWTRMLEGTGTPWVPYHTYTYTRYGDTAMTLDFYPAQFPSDPDIRSSKRPCIIVIHGGSWSSGDARQLPGLNSVLAPEGYNVAAINYRLAPRYRSPAPVEDVAAALTYLRLHADALCIDTTGFVLLGRSAGAQIALLAAYTLPPATTGNGIKGVISYYGPADMVWGYSLPASPLVMDSRKVMRDYLGGPYDKVPGNYAASSPIEFAVSRAVPTLIIHGKNDVLVAYEHSTRLSKKLEASGVPHFLLTLPWATHGCDYILNGPSGQLSTYSVEAFLRYVVH